MQYGFVKLNIAETTQRNKNKPIFYRISSTFNNFVEKKLNLIKTTKYAIKTILIKVQHFNKHILGNGAKKLRVPTILF